MTREPFILIEGTRLTDAQAMALRVATSNMLLDLSDDGFRARLGPVADDYRARLREIVWLMLNPLAGQ